MKRRFKVYCSTAALLVASAVLLYLFHTETSTSELAGKTSNSELITARSREQRPREQVRLGASRQTEASDSPLFKQLRNRWLEIGEGNERIAERLQLSKETASLLLCTAESIKLIELLDQLGIYNVISSEIEAILSSTEGQDARRSFINLAKYPPEGSMNHLQTWAQAAGYGCPPDEFQEFCEEIQNKACRQEATFGQTLSLVSTNPEFAVSVALQQLATNTDSLNRGNFLNKLIGSLPEFVNFDEIEQALNVSAPAVGKSIVAEALPTLFKTWAQFSPDAAANYLLDHDDHLPPVLINQVALVVVAKDGVAGLDWIQGLPDGPHFDHAAVIGVDYFRVNFPKEARQLAGLIGDAQARRRALARANAPFQEPSH